MKTHSPKEILDCEIAFWKTILPDCEIVFDVGCRQDNIFYEMNPDLKEVHLFDPNKHEKLMVKIVDKPTVHFNHFALGNTTEEKTFYTDYGSFQENLWYAEFQTPDWQHKEVVKVGKLIDYVNEKDITHIDFLKIDAEGFELEIIKGCEEFIHNIDYIQFEDFHTFYNGETIKDIFEFFYKIGYRVYFVGGLPDNYVATKKTITTLKEIKKDE